MNSTPSKVEAKSGLRLVNYHDDTVISDDDDNDGDSSNQEDIEMETSDREADIETEVNNENVEPTNEPKRDRCAEYGFALPPEPKGKCPEELQEKIRAMYAKMRSNNMDMNKLIQERKEFRNPSIYEKLIQFCDIDELGTNYPPELYDPMQWTSKCDIIFDFPTEWNDIFLIVCGFSFSLLVWFSRSDSKESFYEELAKVQKIEMDKREKELSKNEMVQVATKKAEDEAKKR